MNFPDDGGRPTATPLPVPSPPAFAGAALWMIFSVSLFTVSHGFVRVVGEEIHPLVIVFSTSLFSFTFYLPWLIRTRFRPLRTDKIRIHWLRAFFNVGGVSGWYFALTMTPLADAVALSLTGPLVVTLGAVLFLGEPARARRWVAMGFGIAGALLIIRPGFQSFIPGYWFVIFSLSCVAGSRLITKHLTQTEGSAAIGAWMALLQVPITFVMAIYFWSWPTLTQLAMMITVGLLVGGAHYTVTVAYKQAEVGSLEPFNFVRLVIAALIGYFVFAESPDTWTWAGGAVIIISTTYIAHREAVRRREDAR
ncbi:MAG: DMT family transporter [Proteobacteria bacterium]|nr:DMT family transporter [Pseudomonadota bacterium]